MKLTLLYFSEKKWLRLFFTFIFLFTLTLWFTSPLLFHLNEGIISVAKNGDVPQYIWNSWTFKKSITANENCFVTHDIFYPIGGNLLMHTYTPLMSIFCLPFKNVYLGINLFILLNYFLSALGAYWLCMRLTGRYAASLLTGIVFAFSAYKISHLTQHYNLILTAAIPFYLVFFFNAFRFEYGKFFPSIQNRLYIGLTMLMGLVSVLNDYYSTFFLIFFSLAWCLFYKLHPFWTSKTPLKRWGILIVVFVLSHILSRLLYLLNVEDNGGIWWSGDLLSYLIPGSYNALWNQDWFTPILSEVYLKKDNIEFEMFLGYGLILALGSLIYIALKKKIPEASYPWFFVTIIFFMLASPAITINGSSRLFLPTSFIHYVPFLNKIRCACRMHMMLFLFLPITITYVWYSINDSVLWNKYRSWTVLALLVFTIVEYTPKTLPILMGSDQPAIFGEIKKSSVSVILPLPLGIRSGDKQVGYTDTYLLIAQTLHEKPTMGGYISRVPRETFQFYENDSICARLMKCCADISYVPPAATMQEKEKFFNAFKANGVLVLPEYRNTKAEQYVIDLIAEKKYTRKEMQGYLFIDFSN